LSSFLFECSSECLPPLEIFVSRPISMQHSSPSFPHSNNFQRRTVLDNHRRWIYILPSLCPLTLFLLTDVPLRDRQFILIPLSSTSLARPRSLTQKLPSNLMISTPSSIFHLSSSQTTTSSLTGESSLARNPNISFIRCS
jgi:hypothetical protein